MAKTRFQAMSIRDKQITVGITAIAILALYNVIQQGQTVFITKLRQLIKGRDNINK